MQYSSFNSNKKTRIRVKDEPKKVPTGPNHFLKKKIEKQCVTRSRGGKANIEKKVNNRKNFLSYRGKG
jgi:hypothetical protein